MSLFRRLFKPKSPAVEQPPHEDSTEAVGLLLLAAREKRDDSLRHSPRLGDLLGLLWQDNRQSVATVHAAFNSVERLDQDFVSTLSRRVFNLQHTLPPTPEGRVEIVVQALHEEIAAIPLLVSDFELTSAETKLFVNVLTLARILLPAELHTPVCEFLVANNEARRKSPEGGDTLPYQELVRENIYRFLSSLSPDTIPTFWEMLRDEEVTREFWPVLRRIRDRKAVPYLLDLLPTAEDEEGHSPLSLDGQKEVISVLREIGDLRAVPVLLAMEKRALPPPVDKPGIPSAWDRALSKTWRERNQLVQVAGQAARSILRNSDQAEAQLLRASTIPLQPPDTLLRPAPPGTGRKASGELMRSAEAPEKTNGTS